MKEMLKKFKGMAIAYPTVIMVVICLVVTAALAGTNLLTKEKIKKINDDNQNAAMARVLKADEYEKKDGYYIARNENGVVGYIFINEEKGYGGTISIMVGINKDGTVNKIECLDVTSETPGLGQNTATDSFREQFVGASGELSAAKYGTADKSKNEINAVASATISSKAVTKAVNEAIKKANDISAKGGQN